MVQHSAREQLRAFFRALAFVKPYWHVYILIFIMRALRGTVHSLPAMIVFKAELFLPHIEKALGGDVPKPLSLGVLLLGGLFGAWVLHDVIMLSFSNYFTWFVGMQISLRMRMALYRHLQSLPLSYFHKRPVGELMYRASTDVDASLPLLLNNVPGMFSAVWSAAFPLMVLVSTGMPGPVWGFFATLIPVYIVVHLLWSVLRRKDARWRVRSQELNATLRESIAGARVVKAFNKGRFEALKYFHRMGDFYRANQLRYFTHVTIMLIQKAPIHSGYPLLYILFGWFVLKGNFQAIQYLGLLYLCRSSLFFVDMVYQNFQQIRTGVIPVQRLLETFDLRPEVEEGPQARPLARLEGRIEFDDVTFSYVEGTPVLKNASFVLEPGKKLGIVGPSGAGKTTLASLLFRSWDPDSGVVRIDGHDVRELKMNTVLKQMGVILQHTHLFRGTIADNIRYANPTATDEEMIAAAEAAGLHQEVSAFPQGYETDVGEGEKISGGQRQRVSIARALIKQPRLLVLDEPTASLDPRTAAHIGETLKEISAEVTTLIISHRLADVEDSDTILVMDDGRIVERGTHEELLELRGLYASLHEQQNAGPPPGKGAPTDA